MLLLTHLPWARAGCSAKLDFTRGNLGQDSKMGGSPLISQIIPVRETQPAKSPCSEE